MALYYHGIYPSESPTGIVAPIRSTAGLAFYVGRAPIHLAPNAWPANKPFIANTFAEFVNALGWHDDLDTFDLCQAADMYFRKAGVGPVGFINVMDTTEHKEAKTVNATANAVNGVSQPVLLAASAYPIVSSIKVQLSASPTNLVEDTDYIVKVNSDGSVSIVPIIGGAIFAPNTQNSTTAIKVLYDALTPAVITPSHIIGGVDINTGKETGIEAVRRIKPELGFVPGFVMAIGWSCDPNVSAALVAKTERLNGNYSCNTFTDLPTSGTTGARTYLGVKQAKEKCGHTSKHDFVCWPKALIGEQQYWMSLVAACRAALTDAENNDVPYVSPSNDSIPITATVLEDGTEVVLDQEQGGIVNSYGVVTAINENGFVLWGNNTAAYPSSTDVKDRFIPCRRMFDFAQNTFILTYFQKVDDAGNPKLLEAIADSWNIQGNSWVAQQYCARCQIEYRAEDNPVTDALNGWIRFKNWFSPYPPAEAIFNDLEYDPEALVVALRGDN